MQHGSIINGDNATIRLIPTAQFVRKYAVDCRIIYVCGAIVWDMGCVMVKASSVTLDHLENLYLSLLRSNAIVLILQLMLLNL